MCSKLLATSSTCIYAHENRITTRRRIDICPLTLQKPAGDALRICSWASFLFQAKVIPCEVLSSRTAPRRIGYLCGDNPMRRGAVAPKRCTHLHSYIRICSTRVHCINIPHHVANKFEPPRLRMHLHVDAQAPSCTWMRRRLHARGCAGAFMHACMQISVHTQP